MHCSKLLQIYSQKMPQVSHRTWTPLNHFVRLNLNIVWSLPHMFFWGAFTEVELNRVASWFLLMVGKMVIKSTLEQNSLVKFFPIPKHTLPPPGFLFIELFIHRGESLLSYYQKWSLKFVCYWCGFNVRSCLFDCYHYTALTNGWLNEWITWNYGCSFCMARNSGNYGNFSKYIQNWSSVI